MSTALLWNTEHSTQLMAMRQEKRLDTFQLSKLACLSEDQLKELEGLTSDDVRSAFYTPSIKAHAGHRLLEILRSLPAAQK